MIRCNLVFFFIVILSTGISAQDVSILNNRFTSTKYFYYFDKSDSNFYRYQNNKYIVYEFPTKKKAQFEISNNGFGYVQPTVSNYINGKLIEQKYDSIFVSLTTFNNKYIIDYYLIKNNHKTLKIDYPVIKSDTVSEYFTALSTNSYSFPFINIQNILNFNSFLFLHDNKLTYREDDKKFYILVSPEYQKKVDLLFSNFVLKNLQNPKKQNSHNLYRCDFQYLNFRTNEQEVKQLIKELKKGTIVNEVIIPSIRFTDNVFNKLIKSEIFYSYRGQIVYLSKNTRTLYAGRQIENIYESKDSLIYYLVYNSDSTKVDTFNVSYSCLKENEYLLKYNQFKDEKNDDFFNIKPIKEDTIVPINKAIENHLLVVDWIEITDNVNNRNLIKINLAKSIFDIEGNNLNCNELCKQLIQRKINMFVSKNITMKENDYPCEIKIGWKESGMKFYCTKKEVNKFVKTISAIIKTCY
jgi:hypothetical protein